MFGQWVQWVIGHRRTVILTWIALTIVGLFAGSRLNEHLTTSIAVPGSESATADEILASAFHENIEGTFTVVLNFKNASDARIADLKEKIARASQVIPASKVTQQRAIGGILFATVGSQMSLSKAAAYTSTFRSALKAEGLSSALVTGPPAIDADVSPVLAADLRRGQAIALLMTLILLILMLGTCRAVFIPFLFALATISTSLGVIYLLAQKMLMVLYIPNIVELIGLGLAIDYSLLVVHRFRKENQGGNEEAAITETMRTAGKTVVISGISVAVALATLLLVPIPFVRS
ncbi:MAG: MMPL family transporter, partial [Actinomycetes bacterium]